MHHFRVFLLFFAVLPSLTHAQSPSTQPGWPSPIRVLTNQVGYEASLPKRAVIASETKLNLPAFQLINDSTGKIVYSGKPVYSGPVDKWKHWVFWTIDFSAYATTGVYRLQVGANRSHPFSIGRNILEKATLSDIIYYLKGQRSAGLIDKADHHLVLPAAAPAANPTSTNPTSTNPTAAPTPAPKDTLDLHGGWYDATGDYGKHLSHLSFSSFFNPQQIPLVEYSLLKTNELLSARPGTDFRQFIRRITDEAMYGADYLCRVHAKGGSFYRTVSAPGAGKLPKDRAIGPEQQSYRIKQSKDASFGGDRTTNDWRSYQSSYRSGGGMSIAALAMAYTAGISGDYSSAEYLETAEEAFAFLEKENPAMTNDGKENILDDYCALTASTELLKATRNPIYEEAATRRANNILHRFAAWKSYDGYWRADDKDRPFFHPSDAGLPLVSLLYYYPYASPATKADIKAAVRRSLQYELKITHEVSNPFGYSRQLVQDTLGQRQSTFFFPHGSEASPWWQGEDARLGSMAAAARLAAPLFVNDSPFADSLQSFALDQLNWILGCNPFDASMLQGTGLNNPAYGFFGTFEYTNAPGGIVNGITSGLNDEHDIDFNLSYAATGKDNDWRWVEQWLPHASWYLLAVAAGTPALPPAQPFRVLVVASRAKDHLKMIAAAQPFFEKMAVANHFDLDFTDDTSLINPANLSRYQVFVMLHLAPFDMSGSQQKALQQFVEDGKGWVGIHAAGLTGKQFHGAGSPYWQWFEDFMGGVIYSPHPKFQEATLVVEDRKHPVTRHLPAKLQIPDEWYEFNKSPRGQVHVLATADESSYHQNKPMGDHPIIWTNQRYRRMIYIGVGHDPMLLADSNYATLLRDAILWAAIDPLPPISMKNDVVNYEKTYTLTASMSRAELTRRLRQNLVSRHFTINNTSADSLTGTGLFKVTTSKTGHYYWLRFDWSARIDNGQYAFRIFNYYEKPIQPGITNDYSKIEYRWWDFRHGHPWSSEDSLLFAGLHQGSLHLMTSLYTQLDRAPAPTAPPRFHVLALYENGGHHLEYSQRAKIWLNQLAADSNFTIDYSTHADTMTETLLANYQLIIQLDYVPYGWKPETQSAFRNYIEQGRGGWIGFHHATLLGEFDGFPMWPWFSGFMGGIRWKDYIGRFARATVHIEDHRHPVMKDVPDSFTVLKEEWYTYDKSPRPNVHVIASVDESSYQPDTTVKMGDHPVIWTNEKMRARNIYIFMGHSPILFDDPVYKKIFSNAIFWAAATPKPAATTGATPGAPTPRAATPPAKPGPAASPFHALAFFSTTVERDHVDFARDAINFYSALAARKGFTFDTTTNWENCNADLKNYQVVLWLNDFPHTEDQRNAFQTYIDNGGAWLGFHVAGYNDKDTHWPWFVNFFGGAVFYNNNWPPLAAKLIVNDNTHPATHRLPKHYTAPINEWYGWRPDPRENKDVRVLLTLDTSNYPLGKKDIIRTGDIPVVWTNTRYKMLYLNMGHGDQNFASSIQDRLLEDAILWLGAAPNR